VSPEQYAERIASWRAEFAGREDSLEATWELAQIEEAAGHYQEAQRTLVPPGVRFTSAEQNQRRMNAFQRLTEKLYELGPDGKPRGSVQESKAERRAAVEAAVEKRTLDETPFGQLYRNADHWTHHAVAESWLTAARELAPSHPEEARRACAWSSHYFEKYAQAWSAHLPASRWDSDGGQEMMEVNELESSLSGTGGPDLPEWVRQLLNGDCDTAAALFPDESGELPGLAAVLRARPGSEQPRP
jgi:hypothetical protein